MENHRIFLQGTLTISTGPCSTTRYAHKLHPVPPPSLHPVEVTNDTLESIHVLRAPWGTQEAEASVDEVDWRTGGQG